MQTLPSSSLSCNALGFALINPGAAWTEVSADGAGGATVLTRIDASGIAAADLAWVVEVVIENRAATGGDTVYATCNDPGAGAASLGVPVLPQTVIRLPFYGTRTPPRVWVYGAASTPDVLVVVSMAKGA